MLQELDIPIEMLPQVCDSLSHFGDYHYQGTAIPIRAMSGDQQSALFGQACFTEGSAKNTYGTGCFMLLNTGEEAKNSQHGLLTTIAWRIQ
ncbi:unnamed protein product, partial [Cyprideis torosa]